MLANQKRPRIGTRRLEDYFDVKPLPVGVTPIGMEVETSFLDESGRPITIEQSQKIFKTLVERNGWSVTQKKNDLLSVISSERGDKLLYEVGRQNLEIATVATSASRAVPECMAVLESLYAAAAEHGAFPSFQPIVDTKEDLLIIPDERDAIWDALDGREALRMIAWMSAVQFTVEVPADAAIRCINNLGGAIDRYLLDYPQERLWRDYIDTSKASYRKDRYGGPLQFESLRHYCEELSKHGVVAGPKLVPYEDVIDLDVPLYLRSIWWYFRLRRYGDRICIEVRPLPRRHDFNLQDQLNFVLETIAL